MEDLNLSQSFEFLNKNDSNSTDNQFIDDTSEIDQFTNQPITKPKITIVKMDSPELDEELIDGKSQVYQKFLLLENVFSYTF